MKLLITQNSKRFPPFVSSPSLQKVSLGAGKIEVLVINEVSDSDSDIISNFQKVSKRADKIFYVCREDNQNETLRVLVQGAGGVIIEDEFYLESVDNLKALTELNTTDLIKQNIQGDVNLIDSLLDQMSRGKDLSSRHLALVAGAAQRVIENLETKNSEIAKVSKIASSIISRSEEATSQMMENNKKLVQEAKKLRSAYNEAQITSKASKMAGGTVTHFPPINYTKRRNLLLIKEVGDMPYLTSFALALQQFLSKDGRKPKLIFLMPIGNFYHLRYKNFTWVGGSDLRTSKMAAETVFTDFPTNSVITTLLEDENAYDYYIIVDRTKLDVNHIVRYQGKKAVYAIPSKGILSQFSLPVKKSITSYEDSASLMCLSKIDNYPTDRFSRESTYYKTFKSDMVLLIQEGTLQ